MCIIIILSDKYVSKKEGSSMQIKLEEVVEAIDSTDINTHYIGFLNF